MTMRGSDLKNSERKASAFAVVAAAHLWIQQEQPKRSWDKESRLKPLSMIMILDLFFGPQKSDNKKQIQKTEKNKIKKIKKRKQILRKRFFFLPSFAGFWVGKRNK